MAATEFVNTYFEPEGPRVLVERLKSLSRDRAGGVVSLQLAWSAALQKLATTRLGDELVELIAKCSTAPRDVDLLSSMIGTERRAPEIFAGAAAQSAFSLEEIVLALLSLCRHLDRDRRQTSLEMAVGFVSCCEDKGEGGFAGTSLSQIVESMLEAHGFDG